VLLRLAGSPRVTELAWQRELLEEAWHRAHVIREPYRRSAPGAPSDSRAAMLTDAYDMKLDRVSLQARTARAMLALSPAHAREMFEWIDFQLRPPSCEDPLVPVLDDYYDTLAAIARRTFGTSFQAQADALSYFQLYLWKAARPTEMLSVAEAVLRYRPAADDALHLETVLQWIFEHGELEPRGFATMGPALVSKISDLDARHRTLGVRNATALRALRRYLVAQVSGPRCADSVAERRALDGFNRLVAGRSEPGLTLISASESRPSRILSPARLDRLWQTGESRWLRNEAVALVGEGRRAYTEAQKNTKVWQDRASLFVLDLERWNGAREPVEADYLYEKAVLLTGFIEIAPSGPLRTKALNDAMVFLRRSAGREPAASWFVHVQRLLDLARGGDRAVILDALASSEEPTLAMYARLERIQVSRRLTQ
jgi:hypothetical protein